MGSRCRCSGRRTGMSVRGGLSDDQGEASAAVRPLPHRGRERGAQTRLLKEVREDEVVLLGSCGPTVFYLEIRKLPSALIFCQDPLVGTLAFFLW